MNKKIAVIGGGPVGLTIAAHLAQGKNEVVLCELAPAIRKAVDKNGISIDGAINLKSKISRTTPGVDDLASDIPDIIFIAVKATALPLICSSIGEFYTDKVTVVSWQNGIDTERIIADRLGEKSIIRGVVNHGVAQSSPGCVHVAFDNSPHFIQELDPAYQNKTEELAQLLSDAGLSTKRSENLIDMVWSKTIMNASLNALCALSGMNMKEAVTDPYAAELYDNILKESIRVARANEIKLGWDYYRNAINYLKQAGEHKPSMLMDIEAGRRTEVDFINGKIREYGNYAGIETPYNNSLISLIKSKEKVMSGKK